MQPAKSSFLGSGGKLIVIAIVLALIPMLSEMIDDGGPSKMGQPERGLMMVITGFIFWPLAVILFLIGVKRLLVSDPTLTTATPVSRPEPPAQNVTITDAWSGQDGDFKANKEQGKQS